MPVTGGCNGNGSSGEVAGGEVVGAYGMVAGVAGGAVAGEAVFGGMAVGGMAGAEVAFGHPDAEMQAAAAADPCATKCEKMPVCPGGLCLANAWLSGASMEEDPFEEAVLGEFARFGLGGRFA